MAYPIFAPNKSKTGGALLASFNSKEQAFYLKVFKQINFDEKKMRENFDWKGGYNIKLSMNELGGLIHAIRTNGSYSFYHSFKEDKTQGSLAYYAIEDKNDKNKVNKGFGFKFNKNGDERKVGMKQDAAESFMEYLCFALNHFFNAIYAEDKEYAKNKAKANEQAPEVPKQEEAPSEPPTDNSDIDF